MKTYNVVIEGQTLALPPGIGEKDDDVRRALAPYFPEILTALLTRKEEGDVVTITVVKKAGSKGLSPLDQLAACAGGKNPAIALYEEIQALGENLGPVEMLELEKRIDEALVTGQKQSQAMERSLQRLKAAAPRPAPAVVMGF